MEDSRRLWFEKSGRRRKGEKEKGGTRREGTGRGKERSQIQIKISLVTKSELMTSTTLYSRDTASQCVHPVLPTLLGTVYVRVHVLTTTK